MVMVPLEGALTMGGVMVGVATVQTQDSQELSSSLCNRISIHRYLCKDIFEV